MKATNYHTSFSWFVVFFAAMGGILYGYDLGIISGALLFIRHDISMTLAQSSFLVGAVLGGGAIATLVAGPLADWFGRKHMIIASAVIFLIGVFILVDAHTYFLVLMGRIVQGIGVGIITIIIPLYLAESLPTYIRGRGIGVFQLMLTAGIVAANLISIYFVPTHNWRGMFLSASIPGFLLLIGGMMLPYSPRWLLTKGLHEKAHASLSKTHKASWLAEEWQNFQGLVEVEKQTLRTFGKALQQARYLKPMVLVLAIACFQQLMGVNSLLQFGALILKQNGLSSNLSAVLGSSAIAWVNFLVTLVGFFLIDSIGRRKLLCFGTSFAAISLLLMAITYWMLPVGQVKGLMILCGILGFILGYAIGPGICIWLVLAELLPTKIRSVGMSIALSANSLVSTIFASVFLPLSVKIGYGGIFFLSAISAVAYCFTCFRFVPEAMNKSLEEIEHHFGQSQSAKEAI